MKDRWTELCELAIVEVDPQKFRAILQELNRLLDEQEGFVPLPRVEQSQPPMQAALRPE